MPHSVYHHPGDPVIVVEMHNPYNYQTEPDQHFARLSG